MDHSHVIKVYFAIGSASAKLEEINAFPVVSSNYAEVLARIRARVIDLLRDEVDITSNNDPIPNLSELIRTQGSPLALDKLYLIWSDHDIKIYVKYTVKDQPIVELPVHVPNTLHAHLWGAPWTNN